MSIRVVLKYLGLVLVVLGAMLLFPLAWSVAAGDGASLCFIVPILVSVVAGGLLWLRIAVPTGSITRREGFALVTCSWIAVALVGALPFTLSHALPTYVDAVFEAMSGFTTTGATVFTSLGEQPQSILLWRNYSQWLGGMGIVTFFVALFPMFGVGAARLFDAEMPGPHPERLRTRIRDTAQALWALYVSFSLAEFLLLWLGGRLPAFDSLNITFGTMPTGGFLHLSDSIGAYGDNTFVTVVVTVFMLAAGVNFALYYYMAKKGRRWALKDNSEFRLYITIFAVASIVIAVDLLHAGGVSWSEAAKLATFQVASVQTTTGFATADFNLWPSLSKGILVVLMVVGASAGSTGGGLKVVRVLVVIKYAYRQVIAAFSPRSVIPLRVGGEAVPEGTVSAIVGMSILYVCALGGGFLVMTLHGLDIVTAFTSVVATVGNVGPGLGAVGAVENYAFIPASGKAFLTICMLIGRLEFVTVIALASPAFWRWR
ncbi:MAG: TrkH family potassium uptake protein [Dehalococcoidia bacterium]|nr:TrkH family potassium uptake protein [Dehalococcoidia bacterium]